MNRKTSKLSQLIRIALISGLALVMLGLTSAGGAATNILVTPAVVTVNCDSGGKIQPAVNAALPGDTILVSGVCNENLTVRDEAARITIDGQGSATIHGPNPAAATITVLGRNITIHGFTITGGRQGISVLRGGSVLIDGNTIQESAGIGIIVLQIGHARIVNNTIQLNPNAGISVQENSFARIGFLDLAGPALGNVIRKNGVAGVIVQSTSGATLVGNSISDNDGPGVSVKGASYAHLAANHIDGNGSDGMTVTQNSYVQLGGEPGVLNPPNDTQVPNGGFGLRCLLNSSAGGRLATLTGAQGAKNFDTSSTNGLYDPGSTPIDDPQFFVRQHYLDFLNREPDAGGLAYWTNEITKCGSDARCVHERRIGVSAAFFVENEFQQTGYYVYRFYKASFGRQPNYSEFISDRGKVIGGSSLEVNKQAFADEWVQRPAFLAAYPITMSNTEVVNKLFDTAGLTASVYDSQRQQEIQAMNAGRSRALVLRDVIEIPDFRNIPDPSGPRYSEIKQISQYNPAFVLMQYFGYLRRDVDQSGYDFWLDVVNNREPNNYRGMVCSFITSAEYQLRFGTVVTRSNADCGL